MLQITKQQYTHKWVQLGLVAFGFVGSIVYLAGVASLEKLADESTQQSSGLSSLGIFWWIWVFDLVVLAAHGFCAFKGPAVLDPNRFRIALFSLVVSLLYMSVSVEIMDSLNRLRIAVQNLPTVQQLTQDLLNALSCTAAGIIMRVIGEYVTALTLLWVDDGQSADGNYAMRNIPFQGTAPEQASAPAAKSPEAPKSPTVEKSQV